MDFRSTPSRTAILAPSSRSATPELRSPPFTPKGLPRPLPPDACPRLFLPFIKAGSMFRKLHDSSTKTVTIYVDDEAVVAEAGEILAAVLLRQSVVWTRKTPVSGSRRAPY